MISLARELAAVLERDAYSAAVINPRFIKPLDREVLARYAARVTAFVTFEDHVKMGGFGSAVVEALEDMGLSVPVIRIGWPDQFIEHGKIDALRSRYGLTVEAALTQVLPLLARRRRPTLVASRFRNLPSLSIPHPCDSAPSLPPQTKLEKPPACSAARHSAFPKAPRTASIHRRAAFR